MTTIKKGDGKFYVGEDEQQPLAEITFQEKEHLVVEHTYVSEELRGQGMGGKLVEKIVGYARDEQKKIDSKCDYTEAKLKSNPEYQDVLL